MSEAEEQLARVIGNQRYKLDGLHQRWDDAEIGIVSSTSSPCPTPSPTGRAPAASW